MPEIEPQYPNPNPTPPHALGHRPDGDATGGESRPIPAQTPAINPALIKQYLEQYTSGDEQGFRNLCTIFDHCMRAKERAEGLSRAYLAQIDKMLRKAACGQAAPNAEPAAELQVEAIAKLEEASPLPRAVARSGPKLKPGPKAPAGPKPKASAFDPSDISF